MPVVEASHGFCTSRTLQSQLSHTTEKLKAKEAEADTLRKQAAIQAVSAKNLQADLSAIANERTMLLRQVEELKAAIARLESQLSAQKLAATQNDNQHALSVQHIKDQAMAEAARHKAAAEEARREAAVQKALSEGWARDLREAQDRLKHEQDKASHLQQRLDDLVSEQQARQMESMRAVTDSDAHVKTLTSQLETSQAEVKRLKAEYASDVKRFEKVRWTVNFCRCHMYVIHRYTRSHLGTPECSMGNVQWVVLCVGDVWRCWYFRKYY